LRKSGARNRRPQEARGVHDAILENNGRVHRLRPRASTRTQQKHENQNAKRHPAANRPILPRGVARSTLFWNVPAVHDSR
jgi:hypothetical protein